MDSASRSSNKANRSVRPAKSINQSINQVPHQSTNQSIIPKIKSRSSDPPQHIVFPSTNQPIKLSTSQPIKRSTSGSKNQSTNRSIDIPSGTQSTDQSLIVNYHSVDISESPEAHERSSLINRSTNQSTASSTDQSINQSWTSWFRSLVMDGIYIDKSPHSPYHRSIGQSNSFEDHLLNTSTNQPINRSWKRPLLFGVCSTLLMLCVVIPVTVYFVQSRKPKDIPPFSPVSTCDIFCTGPVLAQIQLAGLFNDSKTFVDLPLVDDPHVVFQAFKALPNHDRDTLRGFLNQWFDSTSVDVLPWNITDWTSRPALIDRLVDPSFQRFVIALNDLWFVLGRQVSPDVYEHPDRHTLLPLKHPYMVVPGGRFREFYYWDSYWIVRGLLLCDMLETAKMIVENLADMVDNFGFVPNGSRQYYLTRSQPPFLAYMVDIVHQKHQNMTWLATMLPSLDKEYDFWMTLDGHAINVTDKHNTSHIVNRYFADVQYPRPESFFEDVMTASELTGDHVGELASNSSSEWPEKAKHLFSELTATAETGWDFSSRWFADRTNISSAETSNIVPVDLNAIMYGFEVILSHLHASLDAQDPLIDEYRNASIARRKAIQALLFDDSEDDHYVWRDYNIKTKGLFGGTNILSNWLPLWTRSFDPDLVDESRVLQQLIDSQLIQAGGLLTTENDIRQQWDCPNAWPPLQHIIMEAVSFTTFDSSDQHVKNSLVDIYRSYDLDSVPSAYSAVGADPGTDQARALSFFLSSQWSKSNFDTFIEQGYMFEKYNAFSRDAGHGGEYDVQAGFGWANGVNLIFLDQYASVLNYTQITDQSWPLPASLPPEQVCKTEPKAPSFVAMSVRSQAEHIQEERHLTFQ